MSTRLKLAGLTYRQQFRKCGKANCTTCQTGSGHGPYWIAQDTTSRKTKYIGKNLPEHILETAQSLENYSQAIEEKRQGLLAQADALNRLIERKRLRDDDRAHIESLGFGDCLLPHSDYEFIQDQGDSGQDQAPPIRESLDMTNLAKQLAWRSLTYARIELFQGTGQHHLRKLVLDYSSSLSEMVPDQTYDLQLMAKISYKREGRTKSKYVRAVIKLKSKDFFEPVARNIVMLTVENYAILLVNGLHKQIKDLENVAFETISEENTDRLGDNMTRIYIMG